MLRHSFLRVGKIFLCSIFCAHNAAFTILLLIELHFLLACKPELARVAIRAVSCMFLLLKINNGLLPVLNFYTCDGWKKRCKVILLKRSWKGEIIEFYFCQTLSIDVNKVFKSLKYFLSGFFLPCFIILWPLHHDWVVAEGTDQGRPVLPQGFCPALGYVLLHEREVRGFLAGSTWVEHPREGQLWVKSAEKAVEGGGVG